MPDSLVPELRLALPGCEVLGDLADRVQWAGDASIYRLVPRVVVIPRRVEELIAVLEVAHRQGVPVCFRAGGTSLSGQAVTDGILVVVSRHLRGIEVLDGGERVRCGPGAVAAWVNAALAPYGRRIGPDPASLQAAQVAGIVANNASGMCCGVVENSYHTVTGLDLILADGWRLDTGAPGADDRFLRERHDLALGLLELAREVRADARLAERIRQGFASKNTVGYSLNALLDAEGPAGILQRLVVGSEGTLAFIASATFRTLPLLRHRATAFLLFPDVEAAGRAVAPLAASGAAAIELLDAVALARVREKLTEPLPAGEPAALLVEYQEADEAVLAQRLAGADALLAGCSLARPAAFSRDHRQQARWWAIRKGLFPSVGAVRALGTAVLIEDVTFPVPALAEGVRALRGLFRTHGWDDAVIFGHAKDGNLHFTLTPDCSQADHVARYDRFMRELVRCVLSFGGHLKAEHGTGRNMAPFVEAQWGPEAMAVMRRLKALLDPAGLLNPGVILNPDPQAHLAHLKRLPAADPLVDRCIECGFCEPVCPTRDATFSPRQRIAALRAMAAGGPEADAVRAVWRHRGVSTCAADGMCSTACPVGIDTGALVKSRRAASHGSLAQAAARAAAGSMGVIGVGARLALHVVGGRTLPGRRVPLPHAAPGLPRVWPLAREGRATYLYLPTCLTRILGPDAVPADLARLCAAAGLGLRVPRGIGSLCCGMPFSSKGFPGAARSAAERTVTALLESAAGCTALVVDVGTCAAFLEQIALPEPLASRWAALKRIPPATFLAEVLAPLLSHRLDPLPDLVLHPLCSEHKQGWVEGVAAAGAAISSRTVVPDAAGCCGMAGEKGWSQPEIAAAASAREAAEAKASGCAQGAATSPTCAANMQAHSGVPYRHLISLYAARLKKRE